MLELKARIFSTLMMIVFLSSCAYDGVVRSEIHIVNVEKTAMNQGKQKFCSDFKVSVIAAQEFFKKSRVISFREMHDDYSYLPCFARGRCRIDGKGCSWEIRAGVTGQIDTEDESVLYGCESCLEL